MEPKIHLYGFSLINQSITLVFSHTNTQYLYLNNKQVCWLGGAILCHHVSPVGQKVDLLGVWWFHPWARLAPL